MGRPKNASEAAQPEITCKPGANYYSEAAEAVRYTLCPQTNAIQRDLTLECLRVLLEEHAQCRSPGLVLNLGCGSAVCGRVLSSHGVAWVGADISRPMLRQAEETTSGLLVEVDCFGPLPFPDEAFDAAISVSAIQWICVGKSPERTAPLFFRELIRIMKEDGAFVAQLYPRHQQDVDMLLAAAWGAGFSGTVYTSFPHASRAKKRFMRLTKRSTCEMGGMAHTCPLSWPLKIPCGGSSRERLDAEHEEYSCHSLRLLRRAAMDCLHDDQAMKGTYDVFEVGCRPLTPCGGRFSMHVWSHGLHATAAGEEPAPPLPLLGAECAVKLLHESKAGVAVPWMKAVTPTNEPNALRRNPHFSLHPVIHSPLLAVSILESPKRSPLAAVMCDRREIDSASGKLKDAILTSIRHHAATVVGMDVMGTDVAILLYIPSEDLSATIRVIFYTCVA
jgi:18S rRNA (guanine1575-N7)-methyltransferase